MTQPRPIGLTQRPPYLQGSPATRTAARPGLPTSSVPRPVPAAPPPPPPAVTFMTIEEVSVVLRVSKMTVYRMVHAGELGAVRVRRSFRVPRTALDEYLSIAEGADDLNGSAL